MTAGESLGAARGTARAAPAQAPDWIACEADETGDVIVAAMAAGGAHGEAVTHPAEVGPTLRRGLAATRDGRAAVVTVRVA